MLILFHWFSNRVAHSHFIARSLSLSFIRRGALALSLSLSRSIFSFIAWWIVVYAFDKPFYMRITHPFSFDVWKHLGNCFVWKIVHKFERAHTHTYPHTHEVCSILYARKCNNLQSLKCNHKFFSLCSEYFDNIFITIHPPHHWYIV